MNYSYWEYESFAKYADVAIIGSGIVGLSSAISLKKLAPLLNVIVLEKGSVCGGASIRNAGFACFGSPSELLDDLKNSSKENVFKLVKKRYQGLLTLRQLLGDEAIEYEPLGGYEVFSDDDSYRECADAISDFNKNVHEITGTKETYRLADDKLKVFRLEGFAHMIENRCEGQLNTGKMIKAFVKKARELDINIINGVEVKSFEEESDGVVLQTSWMKLKVKQLLLATNAYTPMLFKDMDVKPGRAQVLITEPIDQLKLSGSFHYDKGYYYFRNVGNRLLIGGGRNLDFEGETTTEIEVTEKIQNAIEELVAKRILPGTKYKVDRRWSGLLGLGTSTKSPIVKAISDKIYCAVRMGGMGVALGSLIGQEAAELIIAGL
jgi:glycine/D-amino acid oxidase-like deaminating enzyme